MNMHAMSHALPASLLLSTRAPHVPPWLLNSHASTWSLQLTSLLLMGFYEIFHLSYWSHVRRQKKALKKNRLRQLQKIEIRIKMDCEGCERRVRQAAETMKRVTNVEVNTKQHKLTVMGYVEPEKVLKRVKAKTGKAAQFWPYVPYDIVPHPYAAGSYDKKAPAGHVRNVLNDPGKAGDLARVNSMEARILSAFSEDNAHACVVM